MPTLRSPALRATSFAVGALLATASCLPEDDIPAPGVAQATFVGDPSQATIGPSVDGWTLSVSRALLGLQLSYQSLETCDVYSQSNLQPLLADALSAEPAYLGRVRGLGECASPIVLSSFVYVSRLGPGVTAADVTTINQLLESSSRTRDTHDVALYLEGTLRRGDEEKRLSWAIPMPSALLACPPGGGGEPTLRYRLSSGVTDSTTLSVHLRELFLDGDSTDASAALRLDPFASADQDGDGRVTIDDLAAVRLTPIAETTGGYQRLVQGTESFGAVDPSLLDWIATQFPSTYSRAGTEGRCALGNIGTIGGFTPNLPGGLGPLPSE